MHYVVTEESDTVTLDAIEAALKAIDPAYALGHRQPAPYEAADLLYKDQVYAEIELNRPGDDLFEDAVAVLIDDLDEFQFDHPEDQKVQQTLREWIQQARLIVGVQIIFGDEGMEPGVALVEPLWDWLFTVVEGVLQVDYEGYYDADGELLVMETDYE
jgi:hypothetical protein